MNEKRFAKKIQDLTIEIITPQDTSTYQSSKDHFHLFIGLKNYEDYNESHHLLIEDLHINDMEDIGRFLIEQAYKLRNKNK